METTQNSDQSSQSDQSDKDGPPAGGGPTGGSSGGIVGINIETEMRGAYLDYAMSVIIGRALPDVRDGLKPVHRRALYAMYDLGNAYNKPYKKSARVVGDVIGKYHPHGDTAVYDTIVRMAQDFSMRYPLVDGQGNFGSVDGDSPAAMRYTEVRMEKITDFLLEDLEKETVDFGPNYDDSLQEPHVFPAKFPNLLVNGSSGIAVGMATNIPPHNLNEIVDASIALIEDPATTLDSLLQIVKGPDFPTAGIVFSGPGLQKAYRTGRGVITMRGQAEIETAKNDKQRIIITELPYQVNKARLVEKIAELVRDKKIVGISDLRDESDRDGMRIVVEIRRNENSNVILNRLYKLTSLQESFGISLLAIHQNQPKVFNLKNMLEAFIEHRKDVVLRRTAFDLKKAMAKAHILEGLKRAVENLDPIIKLIRAAKGPNEARSGLMQKFEFSEIQAQAILDMRLQRLTGLERDKIVADHDLVIQLIKKLKEILGSEERVFKIIREELSEIKEKYGDDRRTVISVDLDAKEFDVEDLIADEEALVTITHRGYIKRGGLNQFKSQRRGGKGIKGAATSDDDFVSAIYKTTTLSYLLCFTDRGKLYWLKVYKIPEASRIARGKAIVNLISLSPGEKIKAILPVKEFSEKEFVVMATKKGMIKKTPLSEFKHIRSNGIIALGFKDGDQLVGAKQTNGNKDIFLLSKQAKCIRFSEDDVRPMGRTARGVTGMNIGSHENDAIVSLEVLDRGNENTEILTVTEKGYGKRTKVGEYRLQSRGGKGIISMKTTGRNGSVVTTCQVISSDECMLVSNRGKMIRIKVGEISEQGRVTQGVRIMNLSNNEIVAAMEIVADKDENNDKSSTDKTLH